MDFSSEGTIIFDPVSGKAKNAWWVIVTCPIEILDYHCHLIKQETGIIINKPLFGSHISVVRGEEPPDSHKSLWRQQHEEKVIFQYDHFAHFKDDYWWLDVSCSALSEVRAALGLSPMPNFDFHLTIGKVNRDKGAVPPDLQTYISV